MNTNKKPKAKGRSMNRKKSKKEEEKQYFDL